jgi:hypothetical protein
MLTDNDLLDIELRHRFDTDVEALIQQIRTLRWKIKNIATTLERFPADQYYHGDQSRLDTSEEWDELCAEVEE